MSSFHTNKNQIPASFLTQRSSIDQEASNKVPKAIENKLPSMDRV
jgi:hypothetical protein